MDIKKMLLAMAEQQADSVKSEMLSWIQSDDFEEELAEKVSTSADSRFAATSNESRVRVESSKNMLATVFPRNAGTFGIALSPTSTNRSVS